MVGTSLTGRASGECVSTPIGHTIVGIALARRLGVGSPAGLAAAVVLANVPDLDIVASMALHGDPWKLHRRATHSWAFAAAVGGAVGAAGLIRTESRGVGPQRVRDAACGALLVGSHVVLDRLPYRSIRIGRLILGMRVANWVLDTVQCSVIAWALWPKGPGAAGGRGDET